MTVLVTFAAKGGTANQEAKHSKPFSPIHGIPSPKQEQYIVRAVRYWCDTNTRHLNTVFSDWRKYRSFSN
jgi:hypothetical protein